MQRAYYSLKAHGRCLVAALMAFALALSFVTMSATSAYADGVNSVNGVAQSAAMLSAVSNAGTQSTAASLTESDGAANEPAANASASVGAESAGSAGAEETVATSVTGGAASGVAGCAAANADGGAVAGSDKLTDALSADSASSTGGVGESTTQESATTDAAATDAASDAADTAANEAASTEANAATAGATAAAGATATAAAKDSTVSASTAASAATASAATTAAKASTAAAKSGWFTIKAALDTSLVLQSKASKAKKGVKIVLAKNGYVTGQAFRLEKLKSGNYRIFIGTGKGSRLYVSNGGSVSVSLKATGENGMFKLIKTSGAYRFVNLATGRALAISGSKAKSGVTLTTKKPSASDKTQRFVLATRDGILKSGIYNVSSALSEKRALSTQSNSTKAGAKAALQNAANTKGQRWLIQKVSGKQNVYTIDNVATGYRLTADSGNTARMKKVSGSSSAQMWKVLGVNGKIVFQNVKTGKVLRPSSGKSAAGTVVGCVKKSEAKSQQWSFTHLASTGTASNKTTYEALGFTVKQMAQWQKSNNPYLASYTISYLVSVLNPSNGSKYKFVDLRKSTGVSASALNAFIKTNGSKGKLAGLGSAFVSAAKKYGLNESYLLAHAILESGWGKSTLAMGYSYAGGKIDGKYYKKGTYYNFYGIGAYDSSPLSGGRKMAIINGWNSPEKAVIGAAQWIAKNYVYASSYAQTTVYSMKWDLARTKAKNGYGWHQYATSTTWADSIANLMGQIYSKIGKTKGFTYIIPKYK